MPAHIRSNNPPLHAVGTAVATYGAAPLIVHCHLRWDFVWQRPQQIMSRLAKHHAILFLEEPIIADGPARMEFSEVFPNVVRGVPFLAQATGSSVDTQCAALLPVLKDALAKHPLLAGRFDRPIHWFNSPMTAPAFIGKFGAIAVVYDCMDELSNFRFAPVDLSQREQFLLSKADIVFTGGYRLYEAKSQHHANTRFYGCGVDVDHFGKARLPATAVDADIDRLAAPVLGYVGVIDERLDYDLIAGLAAAFPTASIAMVGPVVKVDPATLPMAPNIHWLGQRAYGDLPAIVKGFDICLMPFALNESTRYINPTKTLEYMAAGKPIVSTAVPDVVRHFTPVVQVGRSAEEFVTLVERTLNVPSADRIEQGLAQASEASWDAIVANIRRDMCEAITPQRVLRSTTMAGDGDMLRKIVRSEHPVPAGAPAPSACREGASSEV